MYTAFNQLQVLVSNFNAATNQALSALPEGEMGFYRADTGALQAAPAGVQGFYALKKNGVVIKTPILTGQAYASNYAAPTLYAEQITIPTLVTGELYQVDIEFTIPGMQGHFNIIGSRVAATADNPTSIATGIVSDIQAALVRQQKVGYFTISNVGAVITITAAHRTYVDGKLSGRQASFKSRLTFPEDSAVLGTVSANATDGVGYGPYIRHLEYVAQGESDPFRYRGWRNNFDYDYNASLTGQYNVNTYRLENTYNTGAMVQPTSQEIIICFNDAGSAPAV
jgi:hypothetical protein